MTIDDAIVMISLSRKGIPSFYARHIIAQAIKRDVRLSKNERNRRLTELYPR